MLQAVVTLAAFTYLFRQVDRAALLLAFSRVSYGSFLLSLSIIGIAYVFGVLRWRLLLIAFGAVTVPSFLRLTKYYLVGAFYNTYLPGGLGGDIVRGLASRDAFGSSGATSALAIVLVERVIGLSGLLLLTSSVALAHPLPGVATSWLWGAAGLLLVCGALLGLALARRVAPLVPEPFAGWLRQLPVPKHWGFVLATLPLSVLCQLMPALSGQILISALVPEAQLLDALLIVPLALCAAFLPITISGAGVREAIFVRLYATLGVPTSLALAASLMLWLSQALVAALGGVWTLFRPVTDSRR